MIIRRRHWVYQTLNMKTALGIHFKMPVTKQQVEHHIIYTLKQIPIKVWAK